MSATAIQLASASAALRMCVAALLEPDAHARAEDICRSLRLAIMNLENAVSGPPPEIDPEPLYDAIDIATCVCAALEVGAERALHSRMTVSPPAGALEVALRLLDEAVRDPEIRRLLDGAARAQPASAARRQRRAAEVQP